MEQPSGTGHAEENKRQKQSCNVSGAYGGDTGNFIGNKFGLTSTETGQIIGKHWKIGSQTLSGKNSGGKTCKRESEQQPRSEPGRHLRKTEGNSVQPLARTARRQFPSTAYSLWLGRMSSVMKAVMRQ